MFLSSLDGDSLELLVRLVRLVAGVVAFRNFTAWLHLKTEPYFKIINNNYT